MKKSIRILTAIALMAILLAATLPVSAASELKPPNPPVRTIPVTGNSLVRLDAGVINNFVMRDGDMVMFPTLVQKGLKAALAAETLKTLPAALPEEMAFVDAMSVTLVNGGKALDKLPEENKIMVSFEHDPEFVSCEGDGALAILHWDEEKGWQEVGANSLEAYSAKTGIFALVRR